MTVEDKFSIAAHDWQSDEYVEWWIGRDAARDETRRTQLKQMLSSAPFAGDAAIAVLDVGGGYGVVTDEVLRAFPQARVTLQDYSGPMLAAARRRLPAAAAQVAYVQSDLCDPSWVESAGGPFDLAVSAIAIHNIHDLGAIGAIYRGIAGLLKPGMPFLNYDLFDRRGGVPRHQQMLAEAGFARSDCTWQQPPIAIIAAYTPG